MKFLILIFVTLSFQYSRASIKSSCELMYEIVDDATIELMANKNMSLANFSKTEAGKKASKHFTGTKGDEIVALIYLLANRLNDESLRDIRTAQALLDKAKKKYKLEDLITEAYHAQRKRINELTVDCVLGETLDNKESEKTKIDPNQVI